MTEVLTKNTKNKTKKNFTEFFGKDLEFDHYYSGYPAIAQYNLNDFFFLERQPKQCQLLSAILYITKGCLFSNFKFS